MSQRVLFFSKQSLKAAFTNAQGGRASLDLARAASLTVGIGRSGGSESSEVEDGENDDEEDSGLRCAF